jgi:hypothetical protein
MDGNKEERVYRLMQTVVRRIREGSESARKTGRSGARKPTAK